jgi:hypothetical protein
MKKVSRENKRSILNRFNSNNVKNNIIYNSKIIHNNEIIYDNEPIENEKNEMCNIFNPLIDSENRKEVNKWERITDKKDIFISFVSDPPGSNFYSSRAEMLVSTLNNHGYDYCVVHFENDRNYYQNCCFKPSFIFKKMEEFNKNIVWIDGDTHLKKSMNEFISKEQDYDIGLVTYTGDMNGFVASPLYIRNTEPSLDLITLWRNHCKNEIESGRCELDHDALKHTVLPNKRQSVRIKLNWNLQNDLHNGSILENVNSNVPNKNIILKKMVSVNHLRPFNLTNQDFIIV